MLPATICLAVPLFEKLELLRKHALAIGVGLFSGVLSSLVSVWILSRAMSLDAALYHTLLPKSVTTAIGMPLAALYGGNGSLTAAVIILTGVWGSMIGPALCARFGIKSPIALGLAIGASSHAAGTTRSLELGPVEGAVSSLSVALCGILTVVLMPLFV